MSRKKHILPNGTKVRMDICEGLSTGIGVITGWEKEKEDTCVVYRIDLIEGENMDMHREKDGELWVNAFEIKEVLR